ncbi:Lrp/AsnC family transcriptional regulator [Paenibacillus mucilaginosus]|uniref:Lrp/AsnC family transcriptional regulator n=1 Tax=Paenibacillus mucilaginosus TaxID=61624 RepID=UPI00059FA14E|nr:Lrp/AsnC family transcriptional regulator [Paenibacillus mucilaginosus]MCG7218215.1 Lrp/AsnC family transcriptional regulator [Paenibacillus mucilaginosus]WDM28823.1 Lrp/AsnC family transcriptional regulator [Paenibacillus mucilaginosus]
MDQTDSHILAELSKNSRITMKELGGKVHLTGQAAASRVAKLEDTGVIEGYSIKINQSKLGCFMHTFITISTNTHNHQPLLSYIKKQEHYIINNYKISGDGCYLLECRFPSNEHVDQFLVGLSEHANYKLSIVIKKE